MGRIDSDNDSTGKNVVVEKEEYIPEVARRRSSVQGDGLTASNVSTTQSQLYLSPKHTSHRFSAAD